MNEIDEEMLAEEIAKARVKVRAIERKRHLRLFEQEPVLASVSGAGYETKLVQREFEHKLLGDATQPTTPPPTTTHTVHTTQDTPNHRKETKVSTKKPTRTAAQPSNVQQEMAKKRKELDLLEAHAKAEAAQAKADQAAADARMKELEKLEQDLAAMREDLHQQWLAEQDRKEKTMAALKAFADAPPPTMPMSMEEITAELAAIDRFVDRHNAQEDKALWQEIDNGETQCFQDWSFKQRWQRSHPGGAAKCECRGHRLWRKEAV